MKMTPKYMADLHMFLIGHNENSEFPQDRVEEHIKYIPHRKLYRYRNFNERELNTLKHKAIWLSSPSSFPDMFDATIPMPDDYYISYWYAAYLAFEIGYIATKRVAKNEPFPDKDTFFEEIMEIMDTYTPDKISEKAKALVGDDLYKSMHEHMIPEEIINPKIEVARSFLKNLSVSPRHTLASASLSGKKDNRNMWENYAGCYTGFCIEFDFSKEPPGEYDKYAWDVLHILPISYYKRRPVFDPSSFIRKLVQAELKLSKLSFGDDFLEQVYRSITAKGYDYRAENEWRIILSAQDAGEYPFPYVSKLIVGKDMREKNILRMCEIADKLSVPLLKQTLSPDKNTLIYVPYHQET